MNVDVLDRLGEIDQADVVRCARVLLRRPVLRAGGPDGELLPLVYRHRTALTELFAGLLGYRLAVERRFARLYKAGPGPDPTRGEPTLTPRGYAYLTLAAAVLTGAGQQVLLSRLVADVRAAAAEAGMDVTDDLVDRRALAAALRYLIALGVITETDGLVAGLIGDTTAEALITVDTALLGQLVAGPIGEARSALELVELAARPGPLGIAHAVRRRLVEQPVTLYADLAADEAAWLRRRARQESYLLERCFGLATETRAEGIAVTDPEDYLTDITFPGPSTVARIALLALPQLLSTVDQREASGSDGRVTVPRQRVTDVCAAIVGDFPAAWSRHAGENIVTLTDDVLRLLRALGLARPEGEDCWSISPAAHRWLPEPDNSPTAVGLGDLQDPPTPQKWSLFDAAEGGEE